MTSTLTHTTKLIADLRFAEYNPRQISGSQFAALKRSIKEFGFVEPVVVNTYPGRENIIVGGHMRTRAAQDLGWTEVPTVEVNLDPIKEKLLNIALNRIHGEWDEDKLAELVYGLSKEDAPLKLSGLEDEEVSRIIDDVALVRDEEDKEEEPEPEPQGEPDSKPGQVYELGPHRLICGDATDPETWKALLGDERADMVWTDPPYNVAYTSRSENLEGQGLESIKNDDLTPEAFEALIKGSFKQMLDHAKDGAPFYVCSGWSSYPTFRRHLEANGMHHSGVIIWVKNVASMGWNDYRYKHEWILKAKKSGGTKGTSIVYGFKDGAGHPFYGGRDEYDVWEYPRKSAQTYLHPTEKPDWLIMRALANSTLRGDIVADPFGGSGSALIACEKLGRRARLIELDPRFCDTIRRRYEKYQSGTRQ